MRLTVIFHRLPMSSRHANKMCFGCLIYNIIIWFGKSNAVCDERLGGSSRRRPLPRLRKSFCESVVSKVVCKIFPPPTLTEGQARKITPMPSSACTNEALALFLLLGTCAVAVGCTASSSKVFEGQGNFLKKVSLQVQDRVLQYLLRLQGKEMQSNSLIS